MYVTALIHCHCQLFITYPPRNCTVIIICYYYYFPWCGFYVPGNFLKKDSYGPVGFIVSSCVPLLYLYLLKLINCSLHKLAWVSTLLDPTPFSLPTINYGDLKPTSSINILNIQFKEIVVRYFHNFPIYSYTCSSTRDQNTYLRASVESIKSKQ